MLEYREGPCISLHLVDHRIDVGKLIEVREIDLSDCESLREVEILVHKHCLNLFKDLVSWQKRNILEGLRLVDVLTSLPLFGLMSPAKSKQLDLEFKLIKAEILEQGRSHDS
jgi:hypothetical protein